MNERQYLISGDKALLSIDRIYKMLRSSYWARERSREIIIKSIDNSLCWEFILMAGRLALRAR